MYYPRYLKTDYTIFRRYGKITVDRVFPVVCLNVLQRGVIMSGAEITVSPPVLPGSKIIGQTVPDGNIQTLSWITVDIGVGQFFIG